MQTKRQIQELLTSAGVAPNRRLGQHFLVDLNLMRLLIDSAGIGPGDVVLEIGTGTASLTEALAEQAGQVVTVELDPTLAGIAQSRLAGATNVQALNTDALSNKGSIAPSVIEAVGVARAKLAEMGRKGPMGPMGPIGSVPAQGRFMLVANLPYDVASPIMINLVKGPLIAEAMCVTVQREVAERMIASPGCRDYGTLSIFLQATGKVERVRTLPASAFRPPPQVESAVVRYVRDLAKSRNIVDMGLLGAVVSLFMGHRRKMLRACARGPRRNWAAGTSGPRSSSDAPSTPPSGRRNCLPISMSLWQTPAIGSSPLRDPA